VNAPAQPIAADGPLLLADIGGYTRFLQNVTAAHATDAFADGAIPDAYAVVSSLLGGIVDRLVPPFQLAKLEGDAVFAYATDDAPVPHGAALRTCIDDCYAAFREGLDAAHEVWQCRCDACVRIDALDLKFILHAGPFVVQEIARQPELVGPEVVMAHRLLKTEAAALVGHGGYALITAAASARFEVPTADAIPFVVRYEHYPPIETTVFPLRRG